MWPYQKTKIMSFSKKIEKVISIFNDKTTPIELLEIILNYTINDTELDYEIDTREGTLLMKETKNMLFGYEWVKSYEMTENPTLINGCIIFSYENGKVYRKEYIHDKKVNDDYFLNSVDIVTKDNIICSINHYHSYLDKEEERLSILYTNEDEDEESSEFYGSYDM